MKKQEPSTPKKQKTVPINQSFIKKNTLRRIQDPSDHLPTQRKLFKTFKRR
jgi:hypothetical protein